MKKFDSPGRNWIDLKRLQNGLARGLGLNLFSVLLDLTNLKSDKIDPPQMAQNL